MAAQKFCFLNGGEGFFKIDATERAIFATIGVWRRNLGSVFPLSNSFGFWVPMLIFSDFSGSWDLLHVLAAACSGHVYASGSSHGSVQLGWLLELHCFLDGITSHFHDFFPTIHHTSCERIWRFHKDKIQGASVYIFRNTYSWQLKYTRIDICWPLPFQGLSKWLRCKIIPFNHKQHWKCMNMSCKIHLCGDILPTDILSGLWKFWKWLLERHATDFLGQQVEVFFLVSYLLVILGDTFSSVIPSPPSPSLRATLHSWGKVSRSWPMLVWKYRPGMAGLVRWFGGVKLPNPQVSAVIGFSTIKQSESDMKTWRF